MKVCTCPEGFLDSVNSLIGEAGALKVSPDLDRLLRQLPLDVFNKDGLGVLIKVQRVQKAAKKDYFHRCIAPTTMIARLHNDNNNNNIKDSNSNRNNDNNNNYSNNNDNTNINNESNNNRDDR